MVKEIIVLRYGHRDVRDYRVTSHCALVARAFGAKKIIIFGSEDKSLEKSIRGVVERWGGPFKAEFTEQWKKKINELKKQGYKIVHLTMYGVPVQEVEEKIGKQRKVAVLVGSQKVERGVYEIADFNVSVTQQPHSEIAALAVFLDRVQEGEELSKEFSGAKAKIIPEKRGKNIIGLK